MSSYHEKDRDAIIAMLGHPKQYPKHTIRRRIKNSV